MCYNFKIVSRTQNGIIVKTNCDIYQLSYKNLNFNLTKTEFDSFLTYLIKIDCNYWEKEYENSIYEKKIPIPTLQSNFIILLDKIELFELITLMKSSTEEFLRFKDFNNLDFWN